VYATTLSVEPSTSNITSTPSAATVTFTAVGGFGTAKSPTTSTRGTNHLRISGPAMKLRGPDSAPLQGAAGTCGALQRPRSTPAHG
jgi:hypothetical protein